MKIETVGIIWNPRRGDRIGSRAAVATDGDVWRRGQIAEAVARVVAVCRKRGVRRFISAPAFEEVSGIEAADEARVVSESDLVVSIGGDGTLLGAARLLAGSETPLWSVHTGSLGFLTEALPSEIDEALPLVFDGRAAIAEIELMAATVEEDGATTSSVTAYNEVAIESGGRGRMVSLAIEIDGAPVTTLDGNGVIIATPAGSTAYNLAAGGPIILSGLGVMVVTPICPHAFSNRPIIVSHRSVVTIRPLSSAGDPHLIADGIVIRDKLTEAHAVTIRSSEKRVRMVRTSKRTPFDVLGEKLGWGDPRRRPGSTWGC
jgi:NAD+ kinase